MSEKPVRGDDGLFTQRINTELRSRVAQLTSRVMELEDLLAVQAEHIRDEQAALARATELAEENRELRAELDALRGSTSWRLTRPLRRLRGGS